MAAPGFTAPAPWRLSILRRAILAADERLDLPWPWRFGLLQSGTLTVERAGLDDPRWSARPGDAFLLAPGGGEQVIAAEAVELLVADLTPPSGPRHAHSALLPDFTGQHAGVAALISACPLSGYCDPSAFSQAYAGLLGASIAGRPEFQDSAEGGDDLVTALVERVIADPGAELTVACMADDVHLSRSALTVRFRRSMGASPTEIIRDVRMQRARVLLRSTDHGIARIGELVGYRAPAAFTRAFHTVHGRSPGEWRAGTSPTEREAAENRCEDAPAPATREVATVPRETAASRAPLVRPAPPAAAG